MEIKKECPQCSAELELDEERGIEKCPFCGYTRTIDDIRVTHINKSITRDETRIEEINLERHIFDKNLETENRKLREEEDKRTKKLTRRIVAVLAIVAIVAVSFFGAKIATSIAHINDIKIGISSKELKGEEFGKVESILKDKGFTAIKLMEIADLNDSQAESDGKVSFISIDGETSFKKGNWFSKKAEIKIEYHTLNPDREPEIRLPWDYFHFCDMDYKVAKQEFRDAGFTDLELVPIVDVSVLKNRKLMNQVEEVSIDGLTIFSEGDYVKKKATIAISFHTDKDGKVEALEEFLLEQEQYQNEGMIQIPKFETSYEKLRYDDVVKQFRQSGFNNIRVEALMDLETKFTNKENKVDEVSVAGEVNFNAGDWYEPDAEIVIRYHSPKSEMPDESPAADTDSKRVVPEKSGYYKGMKYDDVLKQFKVLGFENVRTVPMNDISGKDILNQIGKVDEVSISGQTRFSAGDMFPVDSDVEIRYHSAKEITDEKEATEPVVNEDNVVLPKNASKYQGVKLDDVKTQLKELGFINIEEDTVTLKAYDKIHKVGNVAEVSINGETNFKADEIFPKNAKVVIRYYVKEG